MTKTMTYDVILSSISSSLPIANDVMLLYNILMESDNVLSIHWGVGYYLISPPYNNNECFKFTRKVNTIYKSRKVTQGEYIDVLKGVLFDKHIGIMILHINDGYISTSTKVTGKNHSTSKKLDFINVQHQNNSSKFHNSPYISKVTLKSLTSNPESPLTTEELQTYINELHKFALFSLKVSDLTWNDLWVMYSLYNKPHNHNRLQDKLTIFRHYSNGNIQCKRCGMTDIRALSLDHINGGGYKHLKEIKHNLYGWIIRNKFPDGFQVLCMNCQWIKKDENNESMKSKMPILYTDTPLTTML